MVEGSGVPINDFWINTMSENISMSNYRNNLVKREDTIIRNIEFAIYSTCYAGMNGTKVYKSIKTPKDLYKLPGDIKTTNEFNGTFRPDLAEAARKGKYKL